MKVNGAGAEVVMFLCDRKACDGTCPSPDTCSHTSDITHAKNFDWVRINEDLVDFFEMEPVTK